jgi:protein-S-isoprenylcysteine O-methyltransferase Ste14
MSSLELKVAPDVVWVVVAAAMWLAARMTPALLVPGAVRVGTAVALIVSGTGLIIAARTALNNAGTTWHPTEPQASSHLVTAGVYRHSRNPTYLGMMIVLLSWAVLLASPLAAVLSILFAIYIDRFQIEPEERVLAGVFGREYGDYLLRVRRWV